MNNSGDRGEQIAMQYLSKLGYKFLRANFTSRIGEIDLIVYDSKYIVFCEVKTRTSIKYGHPLETITPAKQRKIRKTAEYFLLEHQGIPLQPRFDVIAIDIPNGDLNNMKITHIDNAF